MKASRLITLLILSIVAVTAAANVDKTGLILKEQREIRRESETSTGEYARFDRQALERMHHAQDKVFELLDGVSTVDELKPDDQVELFNALEEVKAVISENDADRQQCWRERKLGTTMKTTRCATMSELRAVKDDTRGYLDSPTMCSSGAGGADCGGNVRNGL